MSETVMNLVNAIRSGDAMETETAFAQAMAEKLSTKIEDMRQSVAQSMFNQVADVATEPSGAAE